MLRHVRVQHDLCVEHEWISPDVPLQWPFSLKKDYVDKPCEIQSFGKGGRRGKGHHMVLTSLFPGCKFLLEQIEVSGAQKVLDTKDVMNQHE